MKISYHAGFDDSGELKKDLLEMSRDIFRLIDMSDDIKTIRVEKISNIIKLNKIADEIIILFGKLKELLPRAHQDPSYQEIEINEIEREISEIEQEMSNISDMIS